MTKIKDKVLVFTLLTIFTSIIFRQYIFKGRVPFPSNLLVSFYSPWKQYGSSGYPGGPPNKPIGFDVLRLFYPYRKFTIEELKNGRWPLWNPYNFSGNIHLATYQAAVFYPLNISYFVFSQIDAWSILVIIQPILAGFFTYLFLKELGLAKIAAFFGSFVFAFSGWMISWSEESLVIEHTALWLPLMLFAIEKYFKKKSLFPLMLFTISLCFSFSAGFLQMTIYSLFTVLSWILFRCWQINRSFVRLKSFFFPFFLSILISGIHLFPAIEAYFSSPRGVVNAKFLFDDYLMRPWHLVTLIAPDFWGNPAVYNYFGSGFYHEKVIYVGIPALFFALYSLFFLKERKLTFFKWLVAISLGLGFYPLGWLLYYSHLPLLSSMIPSRIFILSTFSLSVLSSFGFEHFVGKKGKTDKWLKIFFLMVIALLASWAFVIIEKHFQPLRQYGTVSFRNLILPTGIFLFSFILIIIPVKMKRFILPAWVLLFSLTCFSSFYFANKILYFSEKRFVFPEVPVISKLKELSGINRFWSYGNGYWDKNMNAYYDLYSPEGYDALFSQKYGELLHVQNTQGVLTTQIGRTDADIKMAIERDTVDDNPYRLRLLSLLGVKYILETKVGEGKDWISENKRFPKDLFNKVWEDNLFVIWEYKKALPRYFLASNYTIEKDSQKTIDLLFKSDFAYDNNIILEELPGFTPYSKLPENAFLKLTKYDPADVRFKTNSPETALLFLSDNYSPGWQAKIDNQATNIYRADYSFRAISIPPGEHEVILEYRPKIFLYGLWATVVGVLMFIVWPLSVKIWVKR